MNKAILIIFHCGSNTGYAIAPLERVFFAMAKEIAGTYENIHFAYPNLDNGKPDQIPKDFTNVIVMDSGSQNVDNYIAISQYIEKNKIEVVFGFDLPVNKPIYSVWRKAGVKKIISYMGAPMSSVNSGLKLLVKKLEIYCNKVQPDHYIFESVAMQDTSVFGRGIPKKKTSIVYLGVDSQKYAPVANEQKQYAYSEFSIPQDRKIVMYSGHMEPRKGVRIIINAAVELVEKRKRKDVHILLFGNKNGEEEQFAELYKHSIAKEYITFGGYRNDLPLIMPCCFAGTIASTGWDSFTMSSVEMASCGLPLVVSQLQGLKETVIPEKTGLLFEPGNWFALANAIEHLLDNLTVQKDMGKAARRNVLDKYTKEKQLENLTAVVKKVIYVD